MRWKLCSNGLVAIDPARRGSGRHRSGARRLERGEGFPLLCAKIRKIYAFPHEKMYKTYTFSSE